jgi:superfamily I DNA and RNA helicase
MHLKNPDWTIGFVFFTRSLYDQILDLIATYYREIHPAREEPDWTKLKVLHAWGGSQQAGFYAILTRGSSAKYRSVNHVNDEIGQCSPGKAIVKAFPVI